MNQFFPGMNFAKKIFAVATLYFTLAGLVTFSLFILEEAFQTTMFGSWAAQDARRWDHVVEATDYMEDFLNTMESLNRWAGWIQPFAYISYRAYADAERSYIESLRAKALAYDPSSMIGREVKLDFVPVKSMMIERAYAYMMSSKVGVICHEPDEDPGTPITVSGDLVGFGNLYLVACPGFDWAYAERIVQDWDE